MTVHGYSTWYGCGISTLHAHLQQALCQNSAAMYFLYWTQNYGINNSAMILSVVYSEKWLVISYSRKVRHPEVSIHEWCNDRKRRVFAFHWRVIVLRWFGKYWPSEDKFPAIITSNKTEHTSLVSVVGLSYRLFQSSNKIDSLSSFSFNRVFLLFLYCQKHKTI